METDLGIPVSFVGVSLFIFVVNSVISLCLFDGFTSVEGTISVLIISGLFFVFLFFLIIFIDIEQVNYTVNI